MTVTRKLILINTLICAAFFIMIMVVFFSFRHVQKVLTTSFTSETRQIIENSNMTREMSRVLSDMSLILRTFYEKNEVLETDGLRLSKRVEVLLEKSNDDEMKASINRFVYHLTSILEQCRQVNLVRDEIGKTDKNIDAKLVSLDNTIAERLLELMVGGEDTSDLEQLSSMIGGWRESFIRIKLEFVQLGLEHFKHPLEEGGHPILILTDDLQLRLRTLTAAAPAIAEHGRELINLITTYRGHILKFHKTVEILGQMLEKNYHEKENILLMMETIDKNIAEKSEEATEALTIRIEGTMKIALAIFFGILPIFILGGITAYSIKKPIQTIIEYIRCLSKGDIPEKIDCYEYKGEFALVMEYLNMLISATNSVTQIAENIAAGDMATVVKERSENDRLMQALNRMIQRLDQIISETRDMIQSVGKGDMYIRGNAMAFKGRWKELVNGMNDLIDGLSNAVAKSAALSHEMELARNIQTCLLPESVRDIHPDFEIAATMIPADEVGGDFYEITLDRTGGLRIAIGDVSGHGVTPGLIMMMAQTIHATVIANIDNSSRDVVIKINNILYENVHERLKENHFMTFNAFKYLGNGKFEHAGVHLRIIVYRREFKRCELITTEGVYLNFKKDISRPTKNSYFELGQGDIMFLYTDGLTEAQNSSGELLDIGGFVNIIMRHTHHAPYLESNAMKENIMADVLKWCDNRIDDDMTLVIVKRKGEFYG